MSGLTTWTCYLVTAVARQGIAQLIIVSFTVHYRGASVSGFASGGGDVRRDPEARHALLVEVERRARSLARSNLRHQSERSQQDQRGDSQKKGQSIPQQWNGLEDQKRPDPFGRLKTNQPRAGTSTRLLPADVPMRVELHNSLAVSLIDSRRFLEAEHEIQAALALQPDRGVLVYNLGVILSSLKRHSEAEGVYSEAMRLDGSITSAHFNLARTHITLANSVDHSGGTFLNFSERERHLRVALVHLTKCLENSPSTKSQEEAYKSIEEAYYQLGDKIASQIAYERFLKVAPQEGLRSRKPVSCHSLIDWLEDQLLEIQWNTQTSIDLYPRIPPSFRSELCSRGAAMEQRRLRRRRRTASFGQRRLRREFESKRYVQLARAQIPLSNGILSFIADYFDKVHRNGGFYKDSKDDPQALLSAGRASLDNDRLALFVSDLLIPLVEEVAGKCLKLGFVKVVIYEEGAELPEHHDQILNEVSLSLVLQSTPAALEWPLILRPDPLRNSIIRDGSINPDKSSVRLRAKAGQALIFRGRDFLHSRPCCLPKAERMMVLLLHYVQKDFPEFSCQTFVNISSQDPSDFLVYNCTPTAVGLKQPPSAHIYNAVTTSSSAQTTGNDITEVERSESRYLLYNPCATNLDPGYCQSQFSNQVVFLLHALSVAKALGRILVLPPFMWMEHQMAEEQHWYPFTHFFDIPQLAKRFEVVQFEDFIRKLGLGKNGGRELWWYYYPPYLIENEPFAYQGRFFATYMNLSFAWPKRMSPFWEVKMAASGRGDEPYRDGEGRRYWTAVRLLLAKMRKESTDFHGYLLQESSRYPATFASWLGLDAFAWRKLPGIHEEAALVNAQASELSQWVEIVGTRAAGKDLYPIENTTAHQRTSRSTNIDVLAFDFAPSYNFQFDRFDFDWELRRNRRALQFKQELQVLADQVVASLFDAKGSFVSLHLRRDGYSEFCQAEEARLAAGRGKLRFGFRAIRSICDPSEEEILEALNDAGLHERQDVFLATNSRDSDEIRRLEHRIHERFGSTMRSYGEVGEKTMVKPEHRPALDLLVAARAQAFVGNAISTFSMNVLMERDVRGHARNSTVFCGLGPNSRWSTPPSTSSRGSSMVSRKLTLEPASASQSSTWPGGDAGNAIDGVNDGVYFHGHCSHTLPDRAGRRVESPPWWRVELGDNYEVTLVRVWNRADCCSGRLRGLEAWLSGRGARTPLFGAAQRCASLGNGKIPSAGEVIDLPCSGQGEVLWLTLGPTMDEGAETDRVLTLCGVEVIGERAASSTTSPTHAFDALSSQVGGCVAKASHANHHRDAEKLAEELEQKVDNHACVEVDRDRLSPDIARKG